MIGVEFADSALDALEGADACVIVTEWPEFAELDWSEAAERMAGKLVIDGRNFVDPRRGPGGGLHLRGHRPLMRRDGDADLQALILAGGEGTRLRPLTSTIPKPVVPLVGRPFISYMLEWLREPRRRRRDPVAAGSWPTACATVLGDGSALGIRLRYVEEPRPLGTGGALKFAEDLLDERFFMLNGDVLTDLDLTAQLEPARADRRARDARR